MTERRYEFHQKWLIPSLDVAFGALYFICFYKHVPLIFNTEPATGGDTGSHLWPVVALREYGLAHFNFRPWNPGNYMGEPLLVHYFPLPFILMALASYLMPIGLSFNIGTFLPVLALPPAVWWCARKVAQSFGATRSQIPMFSAASGILALGALFNHGNTMWGGNVYSDLSGQFAHQYALVFLFLFLGTLPEVLSQKRTIVSASLLFAAIVLSHAYVALFLPVIFLAIILTFAGPLLPTKLAKLFQIGLLGSLLSAWFWWPLIDNSKWTTPFSMTWVFGDWIAEVFPVTIAPALLIFTVGLIGWCFVPRAMQKVGAGVAFCIVPICFAFVAFKYFDRIGLVDVRALPQMHYFLGIGAALLLSAIVRVPTRKASLIAFVVIVTLAVAQYRLIKGELRTSQDWVHWNYTGWTSKPAFNSMRSISEEVRGSFNDPRILFEHGEESSNEAGTPRVWEMLPHFAGRSTIDGLYMQSTILAVQSFYIQSAISASPSCPFPNYDCAGLDFGKGLRLASLMGVNTLILNSKVSFAAADKIPKLSLKLDAPPWRIYHYDEPVASPYVLFSDTPPKFIAQDNWRRPFWNWFLNYKPGDSLIIATNDPNDPKLESLFPSPKASCTPNVSISFEGIRLQTPCPGSFHVLKFAFHDSWRADSGDKLWLVSPGFIGITPSKSAVFLKFGQSLSWKLTAWVSLMTFLGVMIFIAGVRLRGYRFKSMEIK